MGIYLVVPSDEEVRDEALECLRGQVDQCPGQQGVVDLHADGKDTDSTPVVRICLSRTVR